MSGLRKPGKALSSASAAAGRPPAPVGALRFDHAVVIVASLAPAVSEFGAAGFTVMPGGAHDAVPTENALVCFADGGYLELLAARDPATRTELRRLRAGARWETHLRGVSAVARRFLPLLAGPDGVADWALRSPALAPDAVSLRQAGVAASGPVGMSRERPEGERLAWQLLLPESFLHPFRIADCTPRERRVPSSAVATTHANGATAVSGVHVRASGVALAALELGGTLGVMPQVAASGATLLVLGGMAVELHEGAFAGAFAVTLAGLKDVPPSLAALGLRAGD